MREYGIYAWFGYQFTLKDRLRLIAEAGFDQVMLWWGDEFAEYEGRRVTHPDLARQLGLKVDNVHAPYHEVSLWDPGAQGEAALTLLTGCIHDCADSGVSKLVLHPIHEPPPVGSDRAAGLKRIGALLETAHRRAVTLAMENIESIAYLEAVFETYQSPFLGFCYDSGHEYCVFKRQEILSRYGSLLRTVHLHDNNGSRDQHLLPGEGRLDWALLRGQLDAADYRGPIMLESIAPGSMEAEETDRETPEAYLDRALKAARQAFEPEN